MKKIMFVCLGNICRSPVAEAVFTHIVKERGLDLKYQAGSSGTSAFHVGADPDPRMQATAEKHGVQMEHHAQQFLKKDYEIFDHIFTMDESNYDDVIAKTQNHKLRVKAHMLREYDPMAISPKADVPDPYYRGGMDAFEEVFDIVWRSCIEIVDLLESGEL